MTYRIMDNSGLLVSKLAVGSWMTANDVSIEARLGIHMRWWKLRSRMASTSSTRQRSTVAVCQRRTPSRRALTKESGDVKIWLSPESYHVELAL
ncbi:hypothetical protein JG688_00018653 [Phytophthora aleatoria]|uniref:Uncharacterized protein n=1 Tax=Phytophthora aleatoria TaxID=2496075 RepID=A0A8J5IAK0_9STRA|nr:hypothetical protein JG688_00018653 [Phytophthora aleatoria]